MHWKDFLIMPAVVLTTGLLWITWDATRTKTQQEQPFQVPDSDDPQAYLTFMREMSAELTYIRSAEAWHYTRAYDSMREAADRLRALLPPGEPLPPFAALADISYRAADAFTFDRLTDEEIQDVLDDFAAYLSREDAVPATLDQRRSLANSLIYTLFLAEKKAIGKEAMLEYTDRLEAQLGRFEDLAFQDSLRSKLIAFRNRIGLLNEPYRLEGKTLAGNSLDTNQFLGKLVLLEFWSTTCGPCVSELPLLLSTYEEHRDDLAIVGISRDRGARALKQFVDDRAIPWPQFWLDSDVGNIQLFEDLGIEMIPHSILLDRNGRVVAFNVRAESLEDWLPRKNGAR